MDRRNSPFIAALADFFLRAGTEGEPSLGFLTQEKFGNADYDYLFTKR